MNILFLCGPVGAGKSKILEELRNRHADDGWVFIPEDIHHLRNYPLCDSQSGKLLRHVDLLEGTYSDPSRYTLMLQRVIHTHKKQQIQSAIHSLHGKQGTIVVERHPLEDQWCFYQMAVENGHINREEFLAREYEESVAGFCESHLSGSNINVLMIKSPVNECLKKISERGRSCEESIDVDFMKHYEKNAKQFIDALRTKCPLTTVVSLENPYMKDPKNLSHQMENCCIVARHCVASSSPIALQSHTH